MPPTDSSVRPKASDIPDRDMLAAVLAENTERDGWAMCWDLERRFPDLPEKVVNAKLRQLHKRKLLDGCCCGCRGDWQLTRAGAELLGVSRYYNNSTESGWTDVPQPKNLAPWPATGEVTPSGPAATPGRPPARKHHRS